MMNYLFALMILLGVIISIFTSRTGETAQAMLESGGEAVELTLSLLGAMCMWSGLMRLAEKSGLTRLVSRALSPFLCMIMPSLRENDEARDAISMNMTANLLGLGNAATPLGLRAMQALKARSPLCDEASRDMVTFVVLNTASITLIPSTLAIMRLELGCENPLDILPSVWISSVFALFVGLSVALLFGRREKNG